ncbi:MAG: hypothetical protein LBI34_02780 [Puniceicoccales bacterium]|nr:hypothetical protein [Puniceicoccales bacterium]
MYDDLFEYFPYFPDKAAILLRVVFPEEADDVLELAIQPACIIPCVNLLEESVSTGISNSINHWAGLPEGTDLEKWKLYIRLWLVCMLTRFENMPRDDIVTSNEQLVRSLIEQAFPFQILKDLKPFDRRMIP